MYKVLLRLLTILAPRPQRIERELKNFNTCTLIISSDYCGRHKSWVCRSFSVQFPEPWVAEVKTKMA